MNNDSLKGILPTRGTADAYASFAIEVEDANVTPEAAPVKARRKGPKKDASASNGNVYFIKVSGDLADEFESARLKYCTKNKKIISRPLFLDILLKNWNEK